MSLRCGFLAEVTEGWNNDAKYATDPIAMVTSPTYIHYQNGDVQIVSTCCHGYIGTHNTMGSNTSVSSTTAAQPLRSTIIPYLIHSLMHNAKFKTEASDQAISITF